MSNQTKNMKSNSPDNFQTPSWAIDCLVPHLKKAGIHKIWEPACGKGNLVRAFEAQGFRVKGTDIIHDGHDFLTALPYESYEYDATVTNPPFSIKSQFLARCYQHGKPFALLMPLTTFDDDDRRTIMAENGVEVILPSNRVNFETPNHEARLRAGKKSRAWFYSAWFTFGLGIGRQLVFPEKPTPLFER